jgi:hypothetical protein
LALFLIQVHNLIPTNPVFRRPDVLKTLAQRPVPGIFLSPFLALPTKTETSRLHMKTLPTATSSSPVELGRFVAAILQLRLYWMVLNVPPPGTLTSLERTLHESHTGLKPRALS